MLTKITDKFWIDFDDVSSIEKNSNGKKQVWVNITLRNGNTTTIHQADARALLDLLAKDEAKPVLLQGGVSASCE